MFPFFVSEVSWSPLRMTMQVCLSVFWVAYVILWTALGMLFYPARLAPFAAGMVGLCLHIYSLLVRMFGTMAAAEQVSNEHALPSKDTI